MGNRKWTKETCEEEARKYHSRREFAKGSSGAYEVALKSKWLDEYDWFEEKKKPSGYWNKEHCFEEAMKYKSRSEFRRGCNSAYNVARKNKWIDDYIWMEDQRFNLITDKVDSVYVYEFKEQNAAYIGRTLIRLQKQRDYQHIFKLDSVSSFAKEHNIAVPSMKILETNLTIKEGVEQEEYWLKKYQEDGWITLNKAKTGSIGGLDNGKWNKDSCYEEAKRYKTRKEFAIGNKSAYQVARINKWLNEYIWFEDGTKIAALKRTKWAKETCYEEARKYHSRSEFQKGNCSAYDTARINKWLNEYIWFEVKIKPNGYWNYEHCYEAALECKSRSEFQKGNKSAYRTAVKNKWLDDYIWLEYINKPNGYWNIYEHCKEESLKYKTRMGFKKGSHTAYVYACKNHWLDEFYPKK